MTDRLATLEAFARVVETGSFTRAARSLEVSRTTMTELIQQLETRLGVRLRVDLPGPIASLSPAPPLPTTSR